MHCVSTCTPVNQKKKQINKNFCVRLRNSPGTLVNASVHLQRVRIQTDFKLTFLVWFQQVAQSDAAVEFPIELPLNQGPEVGYTDSWIG